MNEACSAGTGSFLEESCLESLGLELDLIAETALEGNSPPDFSDQCSAFIGSDIKTAIHEGLSRPDIAAGLVYSVCRNYLNRVRGNRRTGQRVFMQGGVCYNQAVPMAMANLCRTRITVPPDPGLMGAFGAALLALDGIGDNILGKNFFDLKELSDRRIKTLDAFVCEGGREKCDRKCTVARYSINGSTYPFGGSCDLYYNRRQDRQAARTNLDLVSRREDLLMGKGRSGVPSKDTARVGIPVSLMTNSYLMLYETFFSELGMEVVRGDHADNEAVLEAGSALCHPVLMAHGYVKNLLNQDLDHIFIPHVKSLPAPDGSQGTSCTCPLVQAEPYILNAAYHNELSRRLVTGVMDLGDREKAKNSFINVGKKFSFSRKRSGEAFDTAWCRYMGTVDRLADTGRTFLSDLDPNEPALVLFGRSYNALIRRGNMGIPGKFTSRGHRVIPYDMLPVNKVSRVSRERMYWASGKGILAAARVVSDTPGLFGVFITSFSCGPDSFILENFRSIMDDKPYLILELDAHTADAGVDTRIEAFLDIIRGVTNGRAKKHEVEPFKPAGLDSENGRLAIHNSAGKKLALTDRGVKILVPSMGQTSARGMAAALRYAGIDAQAASPPGRDELELGKQNASCKECLPYLLTSGSLKKHVCGRDRNEVTLYFMPEADGPCRFGLYGQALQNMIREDRLENVAILSPTSNNSYSGLPAEFTRRGLLSIAITDGLADVRSGVLTLAREREAAMETFADIQDSILLSLESDPEKKVMEVLKSCMSKLSCLERTGSVVEATKVLLTGEIYVRRDGFSSYHLADRLAQEGIWVQTSPVMEWLLYTDHIVLKGLLDRASIKERLSVWVRNLYCTRMTGRIQDILELSGFYKRHPVDMGFLLKRGRVLVDPRLTGEAVLTVSSTLTEIGDSVHGVISVSPFGCMPGRIAESVITRRLEKDKHLFSRKNSRFWQEHQGRLPLPFLALETDGNPMSQMVETKLDSFVMSAHRLKKELKRIREK
jgi:predicted nucleotide-binding protein (sugar kinase/HSP70/actin superfamily)